MVKEKTLVKISAAWSLNCISIQAVLNRKMSKKTGRKYAERQKTSEVEKPLLDQFQTGEW